MLKSSKNVLIDNFIRRRRHANTYNFLEWVEPEQFRNIELLAKGGYGTIYTATWIDGPIYRQGPYKNSRHKLRKNPNETVALKTLYDSSNGIEKLLKETDQTLQFSRVKIYGLTKNPCNDEYAIVMLYYKHGDLRNFLKKYETHGMIDILRSIINDLESIHNAGVIHCDLHSGNILLPNANTAIIADYGLAQPASHITSTDSDSAYGVIPYMAPELLRGKPKSKKSDIYALGIIMWELSSGEPAFFDQKHDICLQLAICGGFRPKTIKGTSEQYAELMQRCWDVNPEKRPTIDELKQTSLHFGYKDLPTKRCRTIKNPSIYYSRLISNNLIINEYLAGISNNNIKINEYLAGISNNNITINEYIAGISNTNITINEYIAGISNNNITINDLDNKIMTANCTTNLMNDPLKWLEIYANFVKILTRYIILDVEPSEFLEDIKAKIHAKNGLPVWCMGFIFEGKQLEDDQLFLIIILKRIDNSFSTQTLLWCLISFP
ncbi:5827_t:CDS:2 [Cetraspora pellucida]|uniref:5827_t:CDS:1 n=1 Tax=Cetraspora pellucida TaxID=1433469 RepID=A0A9N9BQU9_9GLOM|nr:5827_t:CDS:2 [Cetraspora pellucida]